MTDCATPKRLTHAQWHELLSEHIRRAAESNAKTREVMRSSTAALERYRLIQELKRRGRI